MADLTYISLFTGAGGLDLGFEAGLEYLGIRARPVCYVESGIQAAEVLASRIEEGSLQPAPLWSDVRSFDGSFVTGVDAIIGGFPCFAADTLVLTSDGFRPIQNLAIGDSVLTHLGRWRRITSVMRRRDAALVRLKGSGIPGILTTEEHPFYARKRGRSWDNTRRSYRRTFSKPEWTPAGSLNNTQFVSQVLPDELDHPKPTEFWWLVGRYLADGWRVDRSGRKNGRVVICCNRRESEGLATAIAAAGYRAGRCEEGSITKFHITKGDFYEFLAPFGRYAHGKTIPGFVYSLEQSKAAALVDGWRSGDGSRQGNLWRITTVSRPLALGMALLSQRAFGTVASVHYCKPRRSGWRIGRREGEERGQYTVQVHDRNRSSFVDGRYGWKLIKSTERAGVGDVFNISVEEDESYVADGCVVHNCQDISIAGDRAGLEGARSGLWVEFARIIRQARPRFVFIENVRGLLLPIRGSDGAVIAEPPVRTVLRDLSDIGFDAELDVFSAAEVGASHERDRCFLFAWRRGEPLADFTSKGLPFSDRERTRTARECDAEFECSGCRVVAISQIRGCGELREPSGSDGLADGSEPELAYTGCLRDARQRNPGDVVGAPGEDQGDRHQRQWDGGTVSDGFDALAYPARDEWDRPHREAGARRGIRETGGDVGTGCCPSLVNPADAERRASEQRRGSLEPGEHGAGETPDRVGVRNEVLGDTDTGNGHGAGDTRKRRRGESSNAIRHVGDTARIRTQRDRPGGQPQPQPPPRERLSGCAERDMGGVLSGYGSLFAPGPKSAIWQDVLVRANFLRPAIASEEIEPDFRELAHAMADLVDSGRTDALRLAGNGVVPIQSASALICLIWRAQKG